MYEKILVDDKISNTENGAHHNNLENIFKAISLVINLIMHNKSSNWLKPNNIIHIGACVFMIQLARCSHFTCNSNGLRSYSE